MVRLPGRGFVAAAFRHRSSRAGDPLLHTHVVVANATQAADGRWTALDGRELYRHAKTAGYLYQAVAAGGAVASELGLRWQAGRARDAPIVEGVPRRVIEHFSQRRAEILELMAARGERSARAAQVATLETRRRKDYGVPVDRLREQWRARAAEHGLDRAALRRVLRPAPRAPRSIASDLAERLEGPDGLTRDAVDVHAPRRAAGVRRARARRRDRRDDRAARGRVPRARRDRRARAVAGERRYSDARAAAARARALEHARPAAPASAVAVTETRSTTALARSAVDLSASSARSSTR